MKVTYPAIFTDVGTNILIEVPDLYILTEANEEGESQGSMADAVEMARDAIELVYLASKDAGINMACPSDSSSVDVNKGTFSKYGESFLYMIDIELTDDRKWETA